VSEPAEREVTETSVTWRDCRVQMCCLLLLAMLQ
jgi:hypothetical protein